MEDKAKPKLPKKRTTGSLAMRVLLISVLLIGLPLLMHSLIMYRQEYRTHVKDLFKELNGIAENRVLLIEDMRRDQENFLNVIVYHISKEKNASFREIGNYLTIMAEKFEVSKIFAVFFDSKGNLTCHASSTTCEVGDRYNFLKQNLENKTFAYVAYNEYLKKVLFYVGKTVYEADGKTPKGAYIIASPAENLMRGLANLEDAQYPLDLSLITNHGFVLASSDKSLEYKRFTEHPKTDRDILLSPLKNLPNAYEMIQESTDLAVRVDVPDIDLMLILDVSEKRIRDIQIDDYIIRIITLLFLIIVVGGGLAFAVTLRISRPLKQLFSVMDRVAKGDQKVRFERDRMGFEINALGEHFNDVLDAVQKQQKETEEERLQKEVYEQELAIAHEIQESILRFQMPETKLDIASKYAPAKEVGGDFYDVFSKNDEELYFTIADAAGKGVSACLYSLGLRSLFRSHAQDSLEDLVRKTNHLFCLDVGDTGMFSTAWLGLFDQKTALLSYVNAGHWPALLKRKDGTIEELDSGGIALGVEEFTKVDVRNVSLKKGDTLLLYSDGVTELSNKKGAFYGKERLVTFLKNNRAQKSEELLENLAQELRTFSKDSPQDDDITLLAFGVPL